MIYKYFVFYNFVKGDDYGFGNAELTTNNKIKSFEDVKAIEDSIAKDKNNDGVVVSNYILLSKEKEGDLNE